MFLAALAAHNSPNHLLKYTTVYYQILTFAHNVQFGITWGFSPYAPRAACHTLLGRQVLGIDHGGCKVEIWEEWHVHTWCIETPVSDPQEEEILPLSRISLWLRRQAMRDCDCDTCTLPV